MSSCRPASSDARVLMLLMLLLLSLVKLGCSTTSCLDGPTKGSAEWQRDVAGSSVIVQWGYGNTCSSVNACFGKDLTTDRALVPQQMPLQVQQGIQVSFLLNEHADLDLSVRLYQVSENDFLTCNSSAGELISEVNTADDTAVLAGTLRIGSNYFIADTSDPLFKCKFGLRLNVTVKPSNCACAAGICSNRGRCITQQYTPIYECECCPEWTGQCCELDHPCASRPCQNSATCVPTNIMGGISSTYSCICREDYYGDHCEYLKSMPCDKAPCTNGASCLSNGTDYWCRCPGGYSGYHCEVNTDECAATPCVHGDCVDGLGEYECRCSPGYSGVNCENELGRCAMSNCQNDAVCVETENGYHCACHNGYTGNRCETKVNLCKSNPCRNATECVDHGKDFSCFCQPGFAGVHCEINVNECMSSPCMNGGRCYDKVAAYRCVCRRQYAGVHCEYVIANTVDIQSEALILNDSSPLRNLTRLQSLYVAAGTLSGALVLALLILAGCYCKMHKPYRSLLHRTKTNKLAWPAPSTYHRGQRPPSSPFFDRDAGGRHSKASVSVPLVESVHTRLV